MEGRALSIDGTGATVFINKIELIIPRWKRKYPECQRKSY